MSRYHYGPWPKERPSRRHSSCDYSSGRDHDTSEGPSNVGGPYPKAAFPKGAPSPYAPPPRDSRSKLMHRRPRTPVRDDLHCKLMELAGPAFADRTRCDDAIDPISQQRIWDSDKNGTRFADYTEIRFLFSYFEVVPESGKKYIRGFAVETIQQLLLQSRKRAKPVAHPVSGAPIPLEALRRAEDMIELLIKAGKMERECDEDPTSWTLQDIRNDPHPLERLRKMAFSVFHPFFTKASVELADDALIKLSMKDLKVLAKEMKGMFVRNFEPYQRRELLAHVQGQAFVDPPYWENDVVPWIYFLLSNIHLVTSSPTASEHLIKFTMYVFVAAIAVVSPSVRERYSDSFALDFDLPSDSNASRRGD